MHLCVTDPITGELIDRATATAWVRGMLEQHFDELFAAAGFARSARGIAYTRKLMEGKQRLDFDFLVRPRYAKDSFQLGLFTTLSLPAVGAKAAELLGEPFVRTKPDLVERELLDTLVRNPPLMLFRTPTDLNRYARWIATYLDERVMPYLEARRTVRDFAEPKAALIMKLGGNDGQWGPEPVLIAAAFLVLGETGRAKELLEVASPPDSPSRPRYEHVFAAVGGQS